MTYVGRVEKGVVIFDGTQRPADGVAVRIEEISESSDKSVGAGLDRLAGKAIGLPPDSAEKHDEYRRRRRDGK